MTLAMEEPSCSFAVEAIDLISAVKGLHGLSSLELHKLLRDSENFTIHYLNKKGSSIKILLDDVKVTEQLLDLVFYLLIVLGGYKQETRNDSMPLMHSAMVACSLYLLTGCICSQWPDLAHVLLAHPVVDVFMDAAFEAVLVAIRFLDIKQSAQYPVSCMKSNLTAEQIVNYLCQQCEASLQFLQSLCQQKMFLERLLRNKEPCEKGGVLFFARAILKLNVTPPFVESSRVVAAVSRLKAKVLSILLSLCESESLSYLDDVASSPGSLDLAKSVALEVFGLLKTELGRDPKHPRQGQEIQKELQII